MVDWFGHRERIVFVLLASREIATVLYLPHSESFFFFYFFFARDR